MDKQISDKDISIIAEIGSVHDGSLGNAMHAVAAASSCGADIVKFQTHIAEAESLENAPMPCFFQGESRMEYFRRTSFDLDQWNKISKHCIENNVVFLSSPFSIEAVELLEEIGVCAYKIPSGEVTNVPLLERVAKTGKSIYLSSGMSNWAELDDAVSILRKKCSLNIMQCTSSYPCPPSRVGLNVMLEMKTRYGLPVGFSDHTLGSAASISASALGASVVEKHFTFSKLMYGSDAKHSMEPVEFKDFCTQVKEANLILTQPVDKDDLSEYEEMKLVFEKSIVTSRSIRKGHTLKFLDLAFKKPGNGISANQYMNLIGRQVRESLPVDHKISWNDLI